MLKATPVDAASHREQENLRAYDQHIATIHAITDSLNYLISAIDSHPYMACEDGDIPVLDKARKVYGETIRKLADGLL